MKNAVLVWLGSILLIGTAGALAQINLSGTFLDIKDVHDLFEIFGAIATVCAVGIAMYGINTWQIQIGAASDHDLARKLAVCLRRYRIAVIAAWHAADSSAVQIRGDTWIGPGGRENFLISIYQARINDVGQVRAELESIEIEAAVIWRGVFEGGFDKLYLIDQKCCNCIDSYLGLLIRGTADDRAFTTAELALKDWTEFQEHGVVDDNSIKQFFDSKSAPIELALSKKLLKGRQLD